MEQIRLTDEQKAYQQRYVAAREAIRQSDEYQEYRSQLESMSKQEVRAHMQQKLEVDGWSWTKYKIVAYILAQYVEEKAIAQGFPSRSLKDTNSQKSN